MNVVYCLNTIFIHLHYQHTRIGQSYSLNPASILFFLTIKLYWLHTHFADVIAGAAKCLCF
jgi:hypothetical protein